jgi:hypothetical protein
VCDLLSLSNELEVAFKAHRSQEIYGPASQLPPGAGLIYSKIRLPIYIHEKNGYASGDALGIILTHECDIERSNTRPFTDHAIIAPIVPLAKLWPSLNAHMDNPNARAFLLNIANGNTNRLLYLPPVGYRETEPLGYGGIIDFNKITSSYVTPLFQQAPLQVLTQFGMRVLDTALQNHLFREKSDGLPLPS